MTDVTNASRTMLMNIHSLEWDRQLCKYVAYLFMQKSRFFSQISFQKYMVLKAIFVTLKNKEYVIIFNLFLGFLVCQ